MKIVMAIIKPFKLEEVRDALTGHRRARPDRDRGQGLRAPEGTHRDLPRRRIRRELPAQDQDRGRGRRPSSWPAWSRRSRPRPAPARSATARSSSLPLEQACASAPARPTPTPSEPAPSKRSEIINDEPTSSPLRGRSSGAGLRAGRRRDRPSRRSGRRGRARARQGRHRLDDGRDDPRPADVVPGLALFYGGLVRTKNMLSVLMQVFAIACVVMPSLWVRLRLQPRLHQRRRL